MGIPIVSVSIYIMYITLPARFTTEHFTINLSCFYNWSLFYRDYLTIFGVFVIFEEIK